MSNSATPTFPIWVLYTYQTVDGLSVCGAIGYTDKAAAQAAGESAVGKEPTGQGFGFMVLPLEAAPA